jgi:hypothetical protein
MHSRVEEGIGLFLSQWEFRVPRTAIVHVADVTPFSHLQTAEAVFGLLQLPLAQNKTYLPSVALIGQLPSTFLYK